MQAGYMINMKMAYKKMDWFIFLNISIQFINSVTGVNDYIIFLSINQ